MKKMIVDSICQKLLTDKGRRMLLVSSLYLILTDAQRQEPDLVKFNAELGFLQDYRGFLIGTIIARHWKKTHCIDPVKYNSIPKERLNRYLVLLIPSWLRYTGDDKYNLEDDVSKVVNLVRT